MIEAPSESPREIPFAEFVALRKRIVTDGFKTLSENEHADLIRRTKRKEKRASELLILAHERLLRRYVKINKRKKRGFSNIDIEESMQEARIALLNAAKKHDDERSKFSTYLFICVKPTSREHNSGDPIIWIGPDKFFGTDRLRADSEVVAVCRNVVDIDADVDDSENMTISETVPSCEDGAETLLIEGEELWRLKKFVRAEMNGLDARDRTIIEMRWFGDEPRTLEEVGQHFGLSRERIRQIEANVFDLIRKRIGAFRSQPFSS